MILTPSAGPSRRPGVILLVVLALLTLFAIVGISFVLYAHATATGSRYYCESQSESRPDVDPEFLLNYFMGQLLFDVSDDERGVYSCLRGHSLARNMFGLDYQVSVDPDTGAQTVLYDRNDVPFNGTGRLHTYGSGLGAFRPGNHNNPFLGDDETGIDDYQLINYTYHPKDNFLRDPERLGAKKVEDNLVTALAPWRTDPNDLSQLGLYVGGWNAPYTYPDLNNVYLSAVKAGAFLNDNGDPVPEGVVLLPSFHRPWLFRHADLKRRQESGEVIGTFDRENPNWTNAEGKYKLLRPRPIDQLLPRQKESRFPYPEDEGGDVKNLVGAPGYYDPVTKQVYNNDSVWLDLDFPVMTAPDGRKFKPLFAPLIMDLDNRVNLNVHGNLRGLNNLDHASNQGWGPWEVNPAKVLDKNPPEWRNLFAGAPGRGGRYNPFNLATPLRPSFPHLPPLDLADSLTPLRSYAPVDFDASNEMALGAPSAQLLLPTGSQCLPAGYQLPGYANSTISELAERLRHPKLYNPFLPTAPNRAFAVSNMEALLRYGDTGSQGLTSDLFHLCPRNFGDPDDPARSAKRRGLVTVHSFDVDRPGVTPYFWTASGAGFNRLYPGAAYPYGEAIAFPPMSLLHPGSGFIDPYEFRPDLRASPVLTALRRLDLNRYLPPYPPIDPETGRFVEADPHQFEVAQRARQIMAAEIFEVLWKVTGTGSPDILTIEDLTDRSRKRFNALRSLAQLAVNIVDYIDPDDIMTPFNWFNEPRLLGGRRHWVFGTELPRVLINEAYAELGGNLRNPITGVWVELYNPLSNDANLSYGGRARLQDAYALLVTNSTVRLQDPDNATGDVGLTQAAVTNFAANPWLLPSNGGPGPVGYYLVGPGPVPFGGPAPSLLAPNLMFRGASRHPTVVLRRLACPYLPLNVNPNDPRYNPLVTVDHMQDVRVYDGNPNTVKFSTARSQPFAATQQGLSAPTLPGRLKHTFGRTNNATSLAANFDWLVHLDRKLISPLELLQVAGCKPHELTHEFMGPRNGKRFGQRAPWFDEDLTHASGRSHRLYRALEFLGTRSQVTGAMVAGTRAVIPFEGFTGVNQPVAVQALAGVSYTGGTWQIVPGCSVLITDQNNVPLEVVRVKAVNPAANTFVADFVRSYAANQVVQVIPNTISDRVPGKINLNTIWDEETFLALCDPYENPQRSNHFTVTQVHHSFGNLMRSRSPEMTPGPRDRPFLSLAAGLTAPSDPRTGDLSLLINAGIDDTLLRSLPGDPARRRLFEIGNQDHPYLRMELLTKIANNVTNRSNIFAVWLTVGFFEVTDSKARPVKLGAELGRAENRHVRHRMFAIVDRSRLTANPGPQPGLNIRAILPPVVATGPVVPYFSIID
jgi:hypothetical protein